MELSMNEEVYHPIARWHKQYQVLKVSASFPFSLSSSPVSSRPFLFHLLLP